MNKKAKIIIIILSMFIVCLLSFIVVDKIIGNKKNDKANEKVVNNVNDVSNVISDNKGNELKQNENDNSNVIDTEKEAKRESDDVDTDKKEKNEIDAVKAVKDALKDKSWLEKNIYVQEDEKWSDTGAGNQKLTFIVCKNSEKPVIVIKNVAEEIRFSKIVLVTFSNGKVVAERINQGHMYHGDYGVDANKCVVNSVYMNKGREAYIYHSIANGQLNFIGEYGTQNGFDIENDVETFEYFVNKRSMEDTSEIVTESEYNEYKESLNVDQYNFVEIGTELTEKNIDMYIK